MDDDISIEVLQEKTVEFLKEAKQEETMEEKKDSKGKKK